MMRYIFIPLMLVFLLALGACSGSSFNAEGPGNGVAKDTSWEGYVGSADYYFWDLIFDYGDPTQPGPFHWGTAELVENTVVDEYPDGWYMLFTLEDAFQDDWLFCDAAVHIWPPDGPPKPQAGKFDYKWDWNKGEEDMKESVMLSLGTWAPAGDFYLAIHCTVRSEEWVDGVLVSYDEETAWGGYWEPKGKEGGYWDTPWGKPARWGGYVYTGSTLRFPDCTLPTGLVKYMITHPGYVGPSYWDCDFDNATYPTPWSDYTVSPLGDKWPGWCVDSRTVGSGASLWVELYCCYDPGLPTYMQSNNWDIISYILTQRNNGYYNTLVPGWTYKDIQDAIWWFKFAGTQTPNWVGDAGRRATIILDAKTNGEGFIPGSGEYYAVLCHNTGSNQTNIIEVDP